MICLAQCGNPAQCGRLWVGMLPGVLVAPPGGESHWDSMPTGKLKYYKWKNHFYEMKGDVGMSVHEKERKQEDAYTKTQTHS